MKLAVVCSNLTQKNERLQPWRYVSELSRGLRATNRDVTLLTDVVGNGDETVCLPTVRRTAAGNRVLDRILWELKPDLTFWHIGLTSSLHLSTKGLPGRHAAVLTTPIQPLGDLLRAGVAKLCEHPASTGIHLAGAMLSPRSMRRFLGGFEAIVVESRSNVLTLERMGIDPSRIIHAPPGVDSEFRQRRPPPKWGGPFALLYAGSPRRIRGVTDLVDAMRQLPLEADRVRLRILARCRPSEANHLKRYIRRRGAPDRITVECGLLSRERVAEEMRGAHLAVLPFRIVPSDVPLAVLEALASGRPVLGTRIGCIGEYVGDAGLLVEPGDALGLAFAITKLANDQEMYERVLRAAQDVGDRLPPWGCVARHVVAHPRVCGPLT